MPLRKVRIMAARHDDLHGFVRDALARGLSRDAIRQALRSAGWDGERADAALAAFADVNFPVPVPRPSAAISARVSFFYLVLFTALGAFAFSLVSLLFGILEHRLPDRVEWFVVVTPEDSIRWSIARICLALPLFLFMSHRIAANIRSGRFARTSAVRLWLSYLAMFIAVASIMGALVTLLVYLLAGDATLRLLLKVLVVVTIGFVVLAYYLIDLRQSAAADVTPPPSAAKAVLAGVVTLVALATMATGLSIIDMPWTARARRLDARRIVDLVQIADAVDRFWTQRHILPDSIAAITSTATVAEADPETHAPYEYQRQPNGQFQLCAAFSQDNRAGSNDYQAGRNPPRRWQHQAGRFCFTLQPREIERPPGG